MPIYELTQSELAQRCAVCGTDHRLALGAIVPGVDGDHVDERLIRLPACAACGSVEFLMRSTSDRDAVPAGSFSHLHRLLVQELHATLGARERSQPTSVAREHRAVGDPMDASTRAAWFATGLRIGTTLLPAATRAIR